MTSVSSWSVVSRLCRRSMRQVMTVMVAPLTNVCIDGAAGEMRARDPVLPRGFAVLRLQANLLRFLSSGHPPHVEACAADPARLLCRVLRLAPASYRRFELAPARQGRSLRMRASSCLPDGLGNSAMREVKARFASVAALAAALGQFGAMEGLSVDTSPDGRSVILCRD